MSVLGIFAILVGLVGRWVAVSEPTRTRLVIFACLYLMHLAATWVYYRFALENQIDAYGYYYDPGDYFDTYGPGFTSTPLVFTILHDGKNLFGGTFLDWSLLFGVTSFLGICLLWRTIENIFKELEYQPPLAAYLPLFFPGLHFWTSAIGKDGPLFLGACWAIWSSIDLKARWKHMAGAIFIMMLFRPHIGFTAALALGAILVVNKNIRFMVRVPLMIGAGMLIVYAAATTEASIGLDLSSGQSISRFLVAQGEVTALTDVAGNSAVYGSFPFKLFSLLFRPLFFDSDDMMYLLASLENLALIILLSTIALRARDAVRLFRKVTYVRFAVLFGTATCLALALVYYNIGLGLRQKTMFVPSIIVVFVSIIALRGARVRWNDNSAQAHARMSSGPLGATSAR